MGRVTLLQPFDWKGLGFSEAVRGINFDMDRDGTLPGVVALTENLLFNPDTNQMEAQRTPTAMKYLDSCTTTGNPIWTPPANKRFRLMGGIITLSKEAACAGALLISLADVGTGNIAAFQVSNAALVATGQVLQISFQLPGNGYLSKIVGAALNNVFSGALTAGACSFTVWGTEE